MFLSWRDIKSPGNGGAEVHTHELLKRICKKYNVIHLSPRYKGLERMEIIEGVTYIRCGNVITVIVAALLFYLKNHKKIDYVVDQCNTHRFFTRIWVPERKRIFYIHQLTREIWDINLRFPFNVLGRKLENGMLKLQRRDFVITVSESTKMELVELGFDKDKIFIIPNAISSNLYAYTVSTNIDKKNKDFVYVGRYSKYKGIDAAVEAIGLVNKRYPDVKLRILGRENSDFIREVLKPLARNNNITIGADDNNNIVLCGFVSESEKYKYLEKSLALLFPSKREGWGIPITEAGALSTPSIVYDSPGLRDAVDYGRAGYICENNTPSELANLMISCIENKKEYVIKSKAAHQFAQGFNWDKNPVIFDEMMRVIKNNNRTKGSN